MTSEPARFDLIVIGAGINGAGIARDGALRGLRVLLLDKGDIASGTTSWSTRLIHGGLRYLEHGELGLVRESLVEREHLLRIAPHLVHPLPLLIPIYQGDQRGRLLIRAGMLAYDALSLGKSLPHHQILDRYEVLQRAPGLDEAGLRGAALYYDGQVEYPERLALENMLDARAHGADVRTYHQADRLLIRGDQVTGVDGHDVLTGATFRAMAQAVINVAGPWVDEVLGAQVTPIPDRLIEGTKGTHIVVGQFPGAPRDALYVEAERDHRPFFIIPWNDQFLIGTTDTRYDGSLDYISVADWEIDWLLEETNRVIPSAGLTRGEIRYSYAGVRPLPFTPGTAEGSVTRRHMVVDHGRQGGPRGLFSIVGGKLTTYRELAQQAVDAVLRVTGRRLIQSRTSSAPLPGGRLDQPWPAFREQFLREAGLPFASGEHLLRVYGARAPQVLASASLPEGREVFDPASGAIAAEVSWAFREEGASTLADVIARRTMAGLGPNAGIGADAAAAQVAIETLGWDTARAAREVDEYRAWVSRYRPRALVAANAGSAS